MIGNEREILFVGYGAMLTEGFVAIMALIAACTMMPGDYFAINASHDAYQALLAAHPNFAVTDLPYYEEHIGLDLHGRTGGCRFSGCRHGSHLPQSAVYGPFGCLLV